MQTAKCATSGRHSCCCERAGMWLLSEQSDMEANECWLNRWVVTLLHWRGFAGDMMHCLTELVGWQRGRSVGCCIQSRSAMHRQNTGGGDTHSPRNLDWCLHHSSTALASLHWHFMTNHNVSVRPPHSVHWDRGRRGCFTEWALCFFFAGSWSISTRPVGQEVFFLFFFRVKNPCTVSNT